MTTETCIETLIARQARLDATIRRLRRFLRSDRVVGSCVSDRDIRNALFGRGHVPRDTMVMIRAWMDRYYPIIRYKPKRLYVAPRVRRVWKVK